MTSLTVAFRVDASLQIGTGHVMRCLTLADALRTRGARCMFICREHPGHMGRQIRERGFTLYLLPPPSGTPSAAQHPPHAAWLGTDIDSDARQSLAVLDDISVDWLVVDHYALDEEWEKRLTPVCRNIFVIDDLADRRHHANLLLDQSMGRSESDYASLTPPDCELLVGPHYSLLRPEFSQLRSESLERRTCPELKSVLVSMGGVDQANLTRKVLDSLDKVPSPTLESVTVVLGAQSPWIDNIRQRAASLPFKTSVLVNTSDMATLMATCDLAIGAAGSTSWERCCLGVPTLMAVVAMNQKEVATHLERFGAARIFSVDDDHSAPSLDQMLYAVSSDPALLSSMSERARLVCDGLGVGRVLERLLDKQSD